VVYEEGKRKTSLKQLIIDRRILHISWKDMVSNEKARELRGQQLLGDIIRE